MKLYIIAAIALSLLSSCSPTSNELVTFTAYKVPAIQTSVPGTYKVIAMQPKLPKAVMAFQIPNKADRGTTDSTNLVVSGYSLTSPSALNSLKVTKSKFPKSSLRKSNFQGWRLSQYSGTQYSTKYIIKDAEKKTRDSVLFVRLAYPVLENNPQNYSEVMDSIFKETLTLTK